MDIIKFIFFYFCILDIIKMLSTTKQIRADSVFKMLTRQSNKPKSKSPPMIELSKLLNGEIKLSEDNPKLRLSIEDYNLMCKDESIKEIIAILLNTNIESLTAFCEDVKVLENYVDLSQSTIKEKKIAKRLPIIKLLTDLPVELIQSITNKFESLLKIKLKDWIPLSKLKWSELSSNPNAIEYLSLPENIEHIDWNELSSNPNAIKFLSLPENKKHIDWKSLSENTNSKALKLLETEIKANPNNPDIDWFHLSKNPDAIYILKTNSKKINWKGLSYNSSDEAIETIEAIQLLKNNSDKIYWFYLSYNPNAIDILKKKYKEENELKINDIEQYKLLKRNKYIIHWNNLSSNSNPKAIDLLREKIAEENKLLKKEYDRLDYIEKIDWANLSKNPNAIELLKENPLKIDWYQLSANENAIELLEAELLEAKLKKYPNNRKINWYQLCANPKAIKLLKNELKEKPNDYENYIVWEQVSRNPKAIKILKENKNKIVWSAFSENPNACEFELLKDRVEFEEKLSRNKYNEIFNEYKLNWKELSKNPCIFTIK